jgi:LAS superfamily LD-carboxypeptidase LdcB
LSRLFKIPKVNNKLIKFTKIFKQYLIRTSFVESIFLSIALFFLIIITQFIVLSGGLKEVLTNSGIIQISKIHIIETENSGIVDKIQPLLEIELSDNEYYVNHAVAVVKSREDIAFLNDKNYQFKSCKKYEKYYELVLPLNNMGINDLNIDTTDNYGNVNSHLVQVNRIEMYDQTIALDYIDPYAISSIICQDDFFTVVIDDLHRLSARFVPSDLADITTLGIKSTYGGQLRNEAAVKYKEMQDDLNKEGINVIVTSSYRSFQQQEYTYNYIQSYQGVDQAQTLAARPGYSEHQLGLAVDVVNEETNYQLPVGDGDTRLYNWLRNNAYKYGFVQTYDGSEGGIRSEIWHLRYVGVETALQIHDNDIDPLKFLRSLNVAN